MLGYTHLQGIAGAESYDARLSVSAAEDGGSHILWSAQVAAPAARLAAICAGTRAVFEAGIAALSARAMAQIAAGPAGEWPRT